MQCMIRDIPINYEIVGDGKPVVMIHGYFVDHRLMTGCMEPIFKNNGGYNYKRIYIDLPGMGKSGSADWIKNADDMLDIIVNLIERIILDQNFLLAGESYGGYIARGILYKMSDMVDGMLLICPVILPESRRRNVADHVVLVKDDKLLSRLTLSEAEHFNSDVVVQSENIYKRYKDEIVSGIEIADAKFLKKFKQTGYEYSFDVDKIEKFQKPVLMLLGKQDSCVGYKDAWNILENFPRATFAVLDMAGHNLHIEQEKLFNSLVTEWLTRACSES